MQWKFYSVSAFLCDVMSGEYFFIFSSFSGFVVDRVGCHDRVRSHYECCLTKNGIFLIFYSPFVLKGLFHWQKFGTVPRRSSAQILWFPKLWFSKAYTLQLFSVLRSKLDLWASLNQGTSQEPYRKSIK